MDYTGYISTIVTVTLLCHVSATSSAISRVTAKDIRSAISRVTANKTSVPDSSWPPKFCNDLDCPKYSVIKTTENYEIREYEPSQWVSTSETNIEYDEATYDMFMRLFGYISGKNAQGKKIAMTAPVINRIIPGQGPACENNFTMSFYMSKSVGQPPAPTDSKVFLVQDPQTRVYVKSFSGYATKDDYIKNARALADALPSSAKYDRNYFYTAGYDAPFKLFDRHNEVWLIGI